MTFHITFVLCLLIHFAVQTTAKPKPGVGVAIGTAVGIDLAARGIDAGLKRANSHGWYDSPQYARAPSTGTYKNDGEACWSKWWANRYG